MKKKRTSAQERITEIMQIRGDRQHDNERVGQLKQLAHELGADTSHLYYEVGDVGQYDEQRLIDRIHQADQAQLMAERNRLSQRAFIVSAIMAGVSVLGALASWLALLLAR